MQTQETQQLLAAALALSTRYRAAMADGRLGWLELAGFLREAPAVKLAIDQVHLVPAEMLDLRDTEVAELAEGVSALLSKWRISHRTQDITQDVLRATAKIIPTVQTLVAQLSELASLWQAHPPVALPLDPMDCVP